jgi:hypothetical protein
LEDRAATNIKVAGKTLLACATEHGCAVEASVAIRRERAVGTFPSRQPTEQKL